MQTGHAKAHADKECLKCGAFKSEKALVFAKMVDLHSFKRKAFKHQLQYVCKCYSKKKISAIVKYILLEKDGFLFKIKSVLKSLKTTIRYIWAHRVRIPWPYGHTCTLAAAAAPCQ